MTVHKNKFNLSKKRAIVFVEYRLNAAGIVFVRYRFRYKHHMDWAKLLPRKHEHRWTKGMGKTTSGKREMIPGRTGLEERSEAANDKSEFGHWEGDSIVCS